MKHSSFSIIIEKKIYLKKSKAKLKNFKIQIAKEKKILNTKIIDCIDDDDYDLPLLKSIQNTQNEKIIKALYYYYCLRMN